MARGPRRVPGVEVTPVRGLLPIADMRNPGLVAFAVTTGILAPVVMLQLAAGPKQREMLFAPDHEALDVAGTHITAALDHRLVDPGETVHLDLTAEKRVEVGIVVFGSSGTEGERVPSPPLAILHETVSLEPHTTSHVALVLRGARSSYQPVGTYSIYVMSPKAADRLALLQRRAGPPVPNSGEIPDLDRDTGKLLSTIYSIGRDDLEGAAAKLYGGTAVARFEAYTRAVSPALALDTPETAPVDRPFTVGVTLKNPTGHAMKLKVALSFPQLDNNTLALPEDAAKAAPSPDVIELGKGETKRVELHATVTRPGVIGVEASVDCVDGGSCYKLFRSGAFDAVQIVGAPAIVGANP